MLKTSIDRRSGVGYRSHVCKRARGGRRLVIRERNERIIFFTFEHQVWNETEEPRVVLFADFRRPLPAPLAALNALLMSVARWTASVKRM